MDTTSRSMIFGTIDGISKKNFGRLQKELNRRFDEVRWKNGALVIQSSRDHGQLKDIFTKITASIEPERFGTLLYVGHGNIVCFYFKQKEYVGRRYKEPTPPDWWKPGA